MRTVETVILAAALLTPSAYAANVVDINRPRITYISPQSTAAVCKKPERRGCTTLDIEFLCACAQTGDKWSLFPHLLATPLLYTTTQDIMRHELEHLADIRSALNEYAAGLMLRSFESEQSCTRFAGDEKKSFGNTLRNIQRLTTIKRDGVRYAWGQT